MDDSQCSGCIQRDRRIADLETRIADLEKRLELKERAGKRQAAPFSKGKPVAAPKKPGRKAGDEHGQHAHRPPPPPDAIDETLEATLPNACPHCGGDIAEDDVVDEQFQTDIPTQPIRRKFRIHKGCCKRCRRKIRGRHPLQTSDAVGAAKSQIGPNAQASIVYLNKRSGMPYGKICDYFLQAIGIDLNPSTATRIVLRASDKLKPTYEEIKQSIADSQYITPDETGWRNGGRPVWLHVAVGDQATCYFIDRRRSADALEKIIGLDYSGTLIHDGFASYDRFFAAIHQQCVAHPLRRAHNLEEALTGRNQLFPRQVIELFQETLALRDDFLAGKRSPEQLDADYEIQTTRLMELTVKSRASEANDTFAAHLHKYSPYWFNFLLQPKLPATNYQAEQALRMPISNRKVFGGNRTDAGCEAQAIHCSTIQTCKQQKRSPFAFLRDALCGLAQNLFQAITGKTPATPS